MSDHDREQSRNAARNAESDRELLEQTLASLEILLRMFRPERVIYLLAAIASLLLLSYAAFLMINEGKADTGQLALLFGSGGLFTIAGTQVTSFLSKSFNLIEKIVHRLGGVGQ